MISAAVAVTASAIVPVKAVDWSSCSVPDAPEKLFRGCRAESRASGGICPQQARAVRGPQPRALPLFEGEIGQRGVDADADPAGAAVDQRGQSEADGVHLGPRRLTGFGDRLDRHIEKGALLQTGYGPLNAVMNA